MSKFYKFDEKQMNKKYDFKRINKIILFDNKYKTSKIYNVFCTTNEQFYCDVEKRGCNGCYYNTKFTST